MGVREGVTDEMCISNLKQALQEFYILSSMQGKQEKPLGDLQ